MSKVSLCQEVNSLIDSLLTLKETTKDSSLVVRIYDTLFRVCSDPEVSMTYQREGFDYATKCGNVYLAARCANRISAIYNNVLHDYKESLFWAYQSEELADSVKYYKASVMTRMVIIATFISQNDLSSAFDEVYNLEDVLKEYPDTVGVLFKNMFMGQILTELRQYDKADNYLFQALRLAEEKNDISNYICINNNLVLNFLIQYKNTFDNKLLEIAFKCGYNALMSNQKFFPPYPMAETLRCMVEICIIQNNKELAAYYLGLLKKEVEKEEVKFQYGYYEVAKIKYLIFTNQISEAGRIIRKKTLSLNSLDGFTKSIDNYAFLETYLEYFKVVGDWENYMKYFQIQRYAQSRFYSSQFVVNNELREFYIENEKRLKVEKNLFEAHQREFLVSQQNRRFAIILYCVIGLFFLIIVVVLSLQLSEADRVNSVLKRQNNEIYNATMDLKQTSVEFASLNQKNRSQVALLSKQKDTLEKFHRYNISSLKYGSLIQIAVIPSVEAVKACFSDAFIFWKPLQIVSGDFYWTKNVGGYKLFAVADCTGHGVPGALLSILGISCLNEVISRVDLSKSSSSSVLTTLKRKFCKTLGTGTDIYDGMELAFIMVKDNSLQFSGAGRPLLLVRSGNLTEFSGNRQSIGYNFGVEVPFKNYSVEVKKGDMLYLFSDGYADQSGFKGKYSKRRFYGFLKHLSNLNCVAQEYEIDKEMLEYTNNYSICFQMDDQLIAGLRI